MWGGWGGAAGGWGWGVGGRGVAQFGVQRGEKLVSRSQKPDATCQCNQEESNTRSALL